MILQGYDFLHLFREDNCTLQIAGSDQYGNIVAGLDLIRREQGERPDDQRQEAFGVTRAGHQGRREEDRQDRVRSHLADCGFDQSLSFSSVLVECR